MADKPTLVSVQLQLNTLERKFKDLQKQYNSIQKSLDLIYDDRDLLADVQNDLRSIKELIFSSDKHNETLSKDIKKTVESKTDEVKDTVTKEVNEVHERTNEMKQSLPQRVVTNILKNFEKQNTTIKKKSVWKRLTSKFPFGIK